MTTPTHEAVATLREFALSFPQAYEDHPWDESVIKVNKKIFVFFGMEAEVDKRLQVGMKLPHTGAYAVQMPFVTPSGYNLGKSGWVTVQIPADSYPAADLPLDLLREWIEESYRAIAPKKFVAQLDQRPAGLYHCVGLSGRADKPSAPT